MNPLQHNETNEFFISLIHKNVTDDIKEFVIANQDNKGFDISYKEDEALKIAARKGNLELVNFLVLSPDLKYHANFHVNNGQILHDACASGNLELVKFLLQCPDLDNKIPIDSCNNNALIEATINNHIDIVSYLLFSPDLKVHADIHVKNQCILSIACYEGYDNLVKLLLLDKNINEKLDVHIDGENALCSAILGWHPTIINLLLTHEGLEDKADLYYENGSILIDMIVDHEEQGLEDILFYKLNFLISFLSESQLISLSSHPGIIQRSHILNIIKNMILYQNLQKELEIRQSINKKTKV